MPLLRPRNIGKHRSAPLLVKGNIYVMRQLFLFPHVEQPIALFRRQRRDCRNRRLPFCLPFASPGWKTIPKTITPAITTILDLIFICASLLQVLQ